MGKWRLFNGVEGSLQSATEGQLRAKGRAGGLPAQLYYKFTFCRWQHNLLERHSDSRTAATRKQESSCKVACDWGESKDADWFGGWW